MWSLKCWLSPIDLRGINDLAEHVRLRKKVAGLQCHRGDLNSWAFEPIQVVNHLSHHLIPNPESLQWEKRIQIKAEGFKVEKHRCKKVEYFWTDFDLSKIAAFKCERLLWKRESRPLKFETGSRSFVRNKCVLKCVPESRPPRLLRLRP